MTRNGHHTFFSLPLHAAPAPSKYSHWPPPDLVQVIFPLQGNVKRIVYLHIHYLFGSFKLGVDALLFLCSWAGNRRGETRHRTQKGVPEDQGHGLPSQRSCSLPPPGGGAGRGAAVGHCTPPSMRHAVPISLLICYSAQHPPPLEFTPPSVTHSVFFSGNINIPCCKRRYKSKWHWR